MKMIILLKVLYRFSAIFIKIPTTFFTELKKTNSKLHTSYRKCKIFQRVKASLSIKSDAGGITVFDFEI
jgi:hypothetical protein